MMSISTKEQKQLSLKYQRLLRHGKHSTVAATAVARRLIFVWVITCRIDSKVRDTEAQRNLSDGARETAELALVLGMDPATMESWEYWEW
mgnify:FL=1